MHKDYWLNSSRFLQHLGLLLLAFLLFALSVWAVLSSLSSMAGGKLVEDYRVSESHQQKMPLKHRPVFKATKIDQAQRFMPAEHLFEFKTSSLSGEAAE